MDLVDYKIKVVDRDGNPMCNFPIVIRYIGESYYGRRTDRDTGIINFQITGRPVEIFIIAPKNFKNEKTQLIELEKIKGNYDLVASFSQDIPQEIKIPHSVNDYGTTEVIFNFYKNQITKQLYTEPLLVNVSFVHRIQRKKINVFLEAKNGKLRIRPIMYSSISMTPYHLDHTPFVHHDGKNVEVFIDTLPRNPSNDKEEVDIYFDIEETEGVTQIGEPLKDVQVNEEKCMCNRPITLSEFENIIKKMRDSEKEMKGRYEILNDRRCTVKDKRTKELLLENLNKVCDMYEINTCIRKIHFLAQIYWESDRFRSTSEYASGVSYDPGKHKDAVAHGNTEIGDGPRYKGRGFLQLTWRKNFEKYFKYVLKNIQNYEGIFPANVQLTDLMARKNKYNEMVSDNLYLAIDSAGWFWVNGVTLSKKGASGNLNYKADADHIEKISTWVNGGSNGKQNRIIYWSKLKEVVKYEKCVNKK